MLTYGIIFLGGVFLGYYTGNLTFRTKVNELFSKGVKKTKEKTKETSDKKKKGK